MIEHDEVPPPAPPTPPPPWSVAYEASAGRLMRLATVLVGAGDAHDLVVDAVQRAVHSPGWPGVREPHAYLVRSLVNAAASERRSAARRLDREQRAAGRERAAHRGGSLDPTDRLDVRRALAGLSAQQRAVVFLAYWEDRSIPEIAAWLAVSEGTVRRQLHRAKSRLRDVLRTEVPR